MIIIQLWITTPHLWLVKSDTPHCQVVFIFFSISLLAPFFRKYFLPVALKGGEGIVHGISRKSLCYRRRDRRCCVVYDVDSGGSRIIVSTRVTYKHVLYFARIHAGALSSVKVHAKVEFLFYFIFFQTFIFFFFLYQRIECLRDILKR